MSGQLKNYKNKLFTLELVRKQFALHTADIQPTVQASLATLLTLWDQLILREVQRILALCMQESTATTEAFELSLWQTVVLQLKFHAYHSRCLVAMEHPLKIVFSPLALTTNC